MADACDIWTAVCKAIQADTKIAALGVKPASIYYAENGAILSEVEFPSVRLMIISEASSGKTSDIGSVNARLQIDVFGVDQSVNRRIADRLEACLDVPRRRPNGFDVCGYSVQSFQMSGGRKAVGKIGIKRDGAEVVQLATDWTLRAKHSI